MPLHWNPLVKLIISDVDETIADLYLDAEPEMCKALERLLAEGKTILLISGQSAESIDRRIVRHITPSLRKNILVGHCSGAEVVGYDSSGRRIKKPFYSLYDRLTDEQKLDWRKVIKILVAEFRLKIYPTMPISQFVAESNGNPRAIMLEDRGPQITFEAVNSYKLTERQSQDLGIEQTDLRLAIEKRSKALFHEHNLSITARLAGVFALDFALADVSKATAVKYIMQQPEYGKLKPDEIEVWGDKFSEIRGGTDRHISEAMNPGVRSISFRQENAEEFPRGHNIVVWDGNQHLHKGLLEYLRSI